jgi:hypothetical protein
MGFRTGTHQPTSACHERYFSHRSFVFNNIPASFLHFYIYRGYSAGASGDILSVSKGWSNMLGHDITAFPSVLA